MRLISPRLLRLCAASLASAVIFGAPLAAQAQSQGQANTGARADCRNCGKIESVQTVQRSGPVNGIAGTQVTPGMALGGVVGGVLGNQVGGGSGRTAATVLGAAGGAYAGHAIEKSRSQYTAYVMRIRMNDGSTRTVEQRSPLARGARVIVDGSSARLANPRRG